MAVLLGNKCFCKALPCFFVLRRDFVSKIIKFIDDDKDLIDKIKEYQKAHGLSSFVAAVRKLCKDALEIEKIRH